jgi:CheY-like chemotaxis protein
VNERVFGVNAMIADMEPLLHRLTGDGVELATVQAAGLWPVRLEPGRLEEVFLALAVDACNAMAGGGTLKVETANLTLDGAAAQRHEGSKPGDYVVLAVSDTARGLTGTVKSAVRGHGRREGLGIRLAFEIAEGAGGHVVLSETPGGGTTVRLCLPRAAAAVPAAEAGAPRGLAGGTETVLVVEDEKSLLGVASRVLARVGYSVLTAGSGEAALRALQADPRPVHLLLTDLVLPGMDGAALSRKARTLRPGLKVLFMSGFSEDALQLKGAVEPGFVLLEKPFTLEGLTGKVRAVLDGR